MKHRKIVSLYPQQEREVGKWIADLAKGGPKGSLLVAPPRSGKTYMLSALLHRAPSYARALVLQHTIDLVMQNAEVLHRHLPDRTVVTRCAGIPRDFSVHGKGGVPDAEVDALAAQVIVGTPQTLSKDLKELGRFDFLVLDEAQRSVCPLYTRMIRRLRKVNSNLRIAGMTATAERSDQVGLGSIFGDRHAAIITLEELLVSGQLVRPRVWSVPVDTIEDWRERLAEISDEIQAGKYINAWCSPSDVVRHYKAQAEGLKALFYTSGIMHSDAVAEAFRAAGYDAVSVSHETPMKLRAEILKEYREGRGPQILVNAFLLTEGFTPPYTECIGLLRWFGSKSTFLQAAMRGLGSCKEIGKKDCIILDFVGAVERHGDFIAGTDLSSRGKLRKGRAYEIEDEDDDDGNWSPEIIGYSNSTMHEIIAGTYVGVDFVAPREEPPLRALPIYDGCPVASSLAEARVRGVTRFFDGRPCIHGHVSVRIIGSRSKSTCLQCMRDIYRQRNKEVNNKPSGGKVKCSGCGQFFELTKSRARYNCQRRFCKNSCRVPTKMASREKSTQCPRGHEFTEENTSYVKTKDRGIIKRCLTCFKSHDLECNGCKKFFKGSSSQAKRVANGLPVYCCLSHRQRANGTKVIKQPTIDTRADYQRYGRQYYLRNRERLAELKRLRKAKQRAVASLSE